MTGQMTRTVLDGVPVVSVVGDIDSANAAVVHQRLLAAVANADPGLVVDLDRARYLDSAGVNLLFELAAELRTRRQQLRLAVGPDVPLRRVLSITGVETTIPITPTVAAAVAAIAGTPAGEGSAT